MSRLPFDTVLIANRGEIAVRILRTLHALGLRGAIMYHDADADSPAVARADHAVRIDGPTPVAAYLDGAQIIAAARTAGAGAIHPGYGFLSENAAFARDVTAAGLCFIGPEADTIALMGDKVRARAFVAAAGFPVAPSVIEDDDPAGFAARARALGPPLLVKPAAGGGGKGMHIVRDLATLDDALETARGEARRYFGDARLYVERYVERPRHIEVQILGDAHGNVVHLHERECSVQRRFQKIIEESPAASLDAVTRARICDAAAGIARAAGYRNAGTVEFIAGDGTFYFLEMNTRLQVEHPVTEMVTGLDLVAEQIRVAAGLKLPFDQDSVRPAGHAIELRLYAEAPGRGFAPTTGRVLSLHWPDGVRVDSGIAAGQRIGAAFDPMLAKLIVHAPDRPAAIARARAALADLVLLGCETNAAFLARVLDDPGYARNEVHTGYLDATPALAAEPVADAAVRRRLLAVACLLSPPVLDAARAVPDLHAAIGGWRN
ncbi:acetyl-CoA carboxylase biotin carboxylase subunit [Acidisphaera rubrifaciens]|uniref:Acetyl-CoA carboxylase biotin carboxylase subunit n=1 Tax=Acidisphaera rubrifaciens HS-AP3 TaxID=1231350 RepID=A0A0D6P823_9PROT|nr:biotin carboxylase N-terminal domain-containing protein [Acidisphaera rubrifaciens]GAN77807.1 acetyl-CoA carboxylase biotin carboxylase subunit [Acidisphaera rubrifaciens HS-AP3]